jgi:hypothetical protein
MTAAQTSPTTGTAPTAASAPPWSTVTKLGLVGVLAGLFGVVSTLVVMVTPPAVTADRFSYPFEATGYVLAEISFLLQHLLLLAVVFGLGRLERGSPSRLIRAGLWLTGSGLLALTGCELLALAAVEATVTSSIALVIGIAYSVAMLLCGVGLVLTGVGVARRRLLPGPARWLPLVLGGYVFVVLFPAVFGPQTAGRVAIGTWMLLFAALGYALLRVGRAASTMELRP